MAAPSTVVLLSGIQAEGATPVWDIHVLVVGIRRRRAIQSHGITVKVSAQKWYMSLPLTFHWPKQVIWPNMT